MFTTVGTTLWLDKDEQIDLAGAIAGCGPAYFFLMIEALIQSGLQYEFTETQSKQLAAAASMGASQLLAQTNEPPEKLRATVTSPGGMTAAAIEVLQQYKLPEAITAAVNAAVERAATMEKEAGE